MQRIEFPEDCLRIQRELLVHFGCHMSIPEAAQFWADFSEQHYAAGWMNVGPDLIRDLTEALGETWIVPMGAKGDKAGV